MDKEAGNKKSATWHTFAIVGLIGLIVASVGWMVLGPSQEGEQAPPPILVFDTDKVMLQLAQPGAFDEPVAGRAELMGAVKEEATRIAEATGAVVLHKNAAIAAPGALDITQPVLEAVERRLGRRAP